MSTETGSDISTTVDQKEVFVNKAKDNYNKHATFSDAWFQFNGTILKLHKKSHWNQNFAVPKYSPFRASSAQLIQIAQALCLMTTQLNVHLIIMLWGNVSVE